jgi:prepilin-type processing-associated H-X9-DG protein
VQKIREAAARIKCANNLKQLALACHMYHDTNQRFPAALDARGSSPYWVGWFGKLLPYIEQDNLYKMLTSANASAANAVSLTQWTCPSDGRGPLVAMSGTTIVGTTTTYVAITGQDRSGRGCCGNSLTEHFGPADGIIQGTYNTGGTNPAVSIGAVTDGLSNTLLLGEQPPGPSNTTGGITNYWNALNHDNYLGVANTELWRPTSTSQARFSNDGGPPCPPVAYFAPGDLINSCSINHLWSFHSGGSNFAFGDGSVHFIPYSASQILIPLATRAGGEVVTIDF